MKLWTRSNGGKLTTSSSCFVAFPLEASRFGDSRSCAAAPALSILPYGGYSPAPAHFGPWTGFFVLHIEVAGLNSGKVWSFRFSFLQNRRRVKATCAIYGAYYPFLRRACLPFLQG